MRQISSVIASAFESGSDANANLTPITATLTGPAYIVFTFQTPQRQFVLRRMVAEFQIANVASLSTTRGATKMPWLIWGQFPGGTIPHLSGEQIAPGRNGMYGFALDVEVDAPFPPGTGNLSLATWMTDYMLWDPKSLLTANPVMAIIEVEE